MQCLGLLIFPSFFNLPRDDVTILLRLSRSIKDGSSANIISRELIDGRHQQPSRLNNNSLVRVRSLTVLTCPCQSRCPVVVFFCRRAAVLPCRRDDGWWDIILTHSATRPPQTHTRTHQRARSYSCVVASWPPTQLHNESKKEFTGFIFAWWSK